MTRFTHNLVVQFSVTSFIIMLILAVVISMVLAAKLNRSVEHLEAHGVAMDAMKTDFMMKYAMTGHSQTMEHSKPHDSTMVHPIKATDPFSIHSLKRDIHNLK